MITGYTRSGGLRYSHFITNIKIYIGGRNDEDRKAISELCTMGVRIGTTAHGIVKMAHLRICAFPPPDLAGSLYSSTQIRSDVYAQIPGMEYSMYPFPGISMLDIGKSREASNTGMSAPVVRGEAQRAQHAGGIARWKGKRGCDEEDTSS